MNPVRIVLALADAIHLAVVQVLSPVADQLDAEQHNQSQPSVPVSVPQIPAPIAGETSEHYRARYPVGLPCSIPLSTKFDPWRFVAADETGEDIYGAWIPLEAAFTRYQPVL